MYNFGNVSKKIRYNFLKLYLSHFTLQVSKIFGFKFLIEIGIRKILTFVYGKMIYCIRKVLEK